MRRGHRGEPRPAHSSPLEWSSYRSDERNERRNGNSCTNRGMLDVLHQFPHFRGAATLITSSTIGVSRYTAAFT